LKLIDTNVVIYAAGRPHRYKAACADILREAARSELPDYAIDVELLQEVLHFYHSRQHLHLGLEIFDELMQTFPAPLAVTPREVAVARDILARYPVLSARDAIHAAVVLNHGLEAIISADHAFDEITEIKRLDPLELHR
jgi:predicted nucleic acid-binding protein